MSAAGLYPRKTEIGYMHWCPGCKEAHHFAVTKPQGNNARWDFNGDLEKPTFSPSMKISAGWGKDKDKSRCHYFLKAGKIQFLGDCTHEMVGKTVDLPEFPE